MINHPNHSNAHKLTADEIVFCKRMVPHVAAGKSFDDAARAQQDFFQMVPTEDGLKSRESIMTAVPKETAFAKFVGECQI